MQQLLDAVERVALAVTVSQGLLLDTAPALIDRGGAEFDDVAPSLAK